MNNVMAKRNEIIFRCEEINGKQNIIHFTSVTITQPNKNAEEIQKVRV